MTDSVDEVIARWQPGDGTAWYLTDYLGTVRDIVDDTGDLINTITYDSFGNIVSQTNAAAGDRFTYTGREYDAELDLYYYRARYYSPQLGRLVSQDPIGFAAGDANLYRYVVTVNKSPSVSNGPTTKLTWRSRRMNCASRENDSAARDTCSARFNTCVILVMKSKRSRQQNASVFHGGRLAAACLCLVDRSKLHLYGLSKALGLGPRTQLCRPNDLFLSSQGSIEHRQSSTRQRILVLA